MHLHNQKMVVLMLGVTCGFTSQLSQPRIPVLLKEAAPLSPSLLSPPSASPQLHWLWHLSDTSGSSVNSLNWDKAVHFFFCWAHFLPVEWAEPAERRQAWAVGNTYLGDSSDCSKLLKWLSHLVKPHPKGTALLNHLIQIKSLPLQKETSPSSHPIAH